MFINDLQDLYNERKATMRQQGNISVGNFLSHRAKLKLSAAMQILIEMYSDVIDENRTKNKIKNKKITAKNASIKINKNNPYNDCNAGIINPEKINVIDYEILTLNNVDHGV